MPNRLIKESSPYLRQHADNPVEWYPWGEEAFEKARREAKPIFLSIGYSSCHWCHVMERECFEDPGLARLLNEYFVSIKVDREERPEIDRHFQEVFVTMNGRAGGWPLSIFMTPEKVPFYSATYIPPEPRYGMMGFGELLETIARRYEKERDLLIEKGREVLEFIKPKSTIQATRIDEKLEEIVRKQLEQVYDREHGGFGGAPKFPHASTLMLALDLYALSGDEALLEIVTYTLDRMALGGIYDAVEGGFCRYSTDAGWRIPHFEKMCYDNALMARVYLRAWHRSGRELYREIAREILDFMLKNMMEEDLFYSASDADSDGEEGGYFTYSYEEALKAFDEAGIGDPETMARRLSITPEGNFEGKNIVRLSSLEERKDPQILQALEALRRLREKREYPFRDRKVLASWNAMMIQSLFEAGRWERRYLEQARRSLEALERSMAEGVSLCHAALVGETPAPRGYLEDYAWWIAALIEGYRSTLEESYLQRAWALCDEAIRRFYAGGRWRMDDGEFRQLAEDTDTGYPSELGVMVQNLLSIRALVDPVYEKFAARTLEVHSYQLMRQPLARATLADAAIRRLRDDWILKAPREILAEKFSSTDRWPWPWIWPKPGEGGGIDLCGTLSCFASAKNWEDMERQVAKREEGS